MSPGPHWIKRIVIRHFQDYQNLILILCVEGGFSLFILIPCLCQHKSFDPRDKAFPLTQRHCTKVARTSLAYLPVLLHWCCKSVWRHMCAKTTRCTRSVMHHKSNRRVEIEWFRCTTRTYAWRQWTSQWGGPSGTRRTTLPYCSLTTGLPHFFSRNMPGQHLKGATYSSKVYLVNTLAMALHH